MTPGKSFFSTNEIRALSARSDLTGTFLILHCYGVIALALAVFALWSSALTFLLAVTVIGSRQLGLAILMHEAAHNALFKTRRLNEFFGEWFCGRVILADLPQYRRYHLQHHRFTQTENDPDLVLSKPFPTTRASLRRKFTRDLSGQTGVKLRVAQIMLFYKMAGDVDNDGRAVDPSVFGNGELGRALLANIVLFALFWIVGAWWWWLAFWALPLLTWFQLVVRIRNIAEHGAVEFSDNPLQNVRTTLAGPLMRLFIAPYWVNYHLEHHLVMHIPAHRLPKVHALMLDKGYGPKMRVGRTYFEVLRAASAKPAT